MKGEARDDEGQAEEYQWARTSRDSKIAVQAMAFLGGLGRQLGARDEGGYEPCIETVDFKEGVRGS